MESDGQEAHAGHTAGAVSVYDTRRQFFGVSPRLARGLGSPAPCSWFLVAFELSWPRVRLLLFAGWPLPAEASECCTRGCRDAAAHQVGTEAGADFAMRRQQASRAEL